MGYQEKHNKRIGLKVKRAFNNSREFLVNFKFHLNFLFFFSSITAKYGRYKD